MLRYRKLWRDFWCRDEDCSEFRLQPAPLQRVTIRQRNRLKAELQTACPGLYPVKEMHGVHIRVHYRSKA